MSGSDPTMGAPDTPRPIHWLRVGQLRFAMRRLPDDALVQIEVNDDDGPGEWPATDAYEQASDVAGVCGTDPQTESTLGVLIIEHLNANRRTRP